MAGAEEILKPGEPVPIPEVSAAGLAGIIGECVDNYDESHRFSKKLKRIAKVLDTVIPLPEEASWKDEIQRLADAQLGIVSPQDEEEQADERDHAALGL